MEISTTAVLSLAITLSTMIIALRCRLVNWTVLPSRSSRFLAMRRPTKRRYASLATETEYVRSRLAEYGNDLISLGVDGLRLDAAKRSITLSFFKISRYLFGVIHRYCRDRCCQYNKPFVKFAVYHPRSHLGRRRANSAF